MHHLHLHTDLNLTYNTPPIRSYYNQNLKPQDTSSKQAIRIKVIPASFGLEGFEDAVWEATQELLPYSLNGDTSTATSTQAMTFVVASPDLSDPILTEEDCKSSSPQAEFASDSFQGFADTLQDKLIMFSKLEGVPLEEAVKVRAFHPMWDGKFPYPCVVVGVEGDAIL